MVTGGRRQSAEFDATSTVCLVYFVPAILVSFICLVWFNVAKPQVDLDFETTTRLWYYHFFGILTTVFKLFTYKASRSSVCCSYKRKALHRCF